MGGANVVDEFVSVFIMIMWGRGGELDGDQNCLVLLCVAVIITVSIALLVLKDMRWDACWS